MTTALEKQRFTSIDVVRGIVMVLMALDHVRDYFHITANTDDPLNLATTTPFLYFTRWITHFCAPTFVFLSGTSIYLQSIRKSSKELGTFLLTRGIWLIIAEVTLITFGWTFDAAFHVLVFQVIWAIGISMVVLGLLVLMRTPYTILLILGTLITAGHNLLDYQELATGYKATLLGDLLHHGGFNRYAITAEHALLVVYPFIPWTGLMLLGYCIGRLFTINYTAERRRLLLLKMGAGSILLFIVLRYSNLYGNPWVWTKQESMLYTLFSFIDVCKYPPSLLYSAMTIGPMLILLALVEPVKNRFTDIMNIFGRTAFFYYILHIYFIHIFAMIAFLIRGHQLSEQLAPAQQTPFLFVVAGEGYSLPVVYLIWLVLLIVLYPLCKWYNQYKSSHRHIPWLSYI